MASPLSRTESEAASSSRAWSSKLSRSARTRSNLKLKGRRVTAGSIVRGALGLTGSGRLFDGGVCPRLVLVVVQRLDPQRPLAVHEDQPAGAEVTAVHEQVGGLVGLAVEVEDRALGHA